MCHLCHGTTPRKPGRCQAYRLEPLTLGEGLSGGLASERNQAAWTDDVRERVLSASLK